MLSAAASGNRAEEKALKLVYKQHIAQFFTNEAAHNPIDSGSRCTKYPKNERKQAPGNTARTLQTKFEGALKVFRAKQKRLQREAQEADERAATSADAAHGPSTSLTSICRMSLAPLPDIDVSTGLLALSKQTWMKINDLHADRGVELQQWLANID